MGPVGPQRMWGHTKPSCLALATRLPLLAAAIGSGAQRHTFHYPIVWAREKDMGTSKGCVEDKQPREDHKGQKVPGHKEKKKD